MTVMDIESTAYLYIFPRALVSRSLCVQHTFVHHHLLKQQLRHSGGTCCFAVSMNLRLCVTWYLLARDLLFLGQTVWFLLGWGTCENDLASAVKFFLMLERELEHRFPSSQSDTLSTISNDYNVALGLERLTFKSQLSYWSQQLGASHLWIQLQELWESQNSQCLTVSESMLQESNRSRHSHGI